MKRLFLAATAAIAIHGLLLYVEPEWAGHSPVVHPAPVVVTLKLFTPPPKQVEKKPEAKRPP